MEIRRTQMMMTISREAVKRSTHLIIESILKYALRDYKKKKLSKRDLRILKNTLGRLL